MNPTISRAAIPSRRNQGGAVLLLSLVFLLILTTLAVTSMREVALETRITGNLVDQKACFNSAEAGLRDGEYRVAGKLESNTPGNYPAIPLAKYGDTIVATPPNAVASCPDNLDVTDACVLDKEPIFAQTFEQDEVKNYAPDSDTVFEQEIVWYAIPYAGGAAQAESENPEYGNAAAGIGPYRHEINSRATGPTCEVDLRSTALRVYL